MLLKYYAGFSLEVKGYKLLYPSQRILPKILPEGADYRWGR